MGLDLESVESMLSRNSMLCKSSKRLGVRPKVWLPMDTGVVLSKRFIFIFLLFSRSPLPEIANDGRPFGEMGDFDGVRMGVIG